MSFWSGILVSYYMTFCFSSFFYLIRCADCSFFLLGGEIFRLTWLNVWDSVGFLSILGDTTFRLLFLLFEKRVIFIDFRVIYIFDFVKFQKTLRSFGESALYIICKFWVWGINFDWLQFYTENSPPDRWCNW